MNDYGNLGQKITQILLIQDIILVMLGIILFGLIIVLGLKLAKLFNQKDREVEILERMYQ